MRECWGVLNLEIRRKLEEFWKEGFGPRPRSLGTFSCWQGRGHRLQNVADVCSSSELHESGIALSPASSISRRSLACCSMRCMRVDVTSFLMCQNWDKTIPKYFSLLSILMYTVFKTCPIVETCPEDDIGTGWTSGVGKLYRHTDVVLPAFLVAISALGRLRQTFPFPKQEFHRDKLSFLKPFPKARISLRYPFTYSNFCCFLTVESLCVRCEKFLLASQTPM